MVELREAEKVLGGVAIRCVSNDYRSASRSIDYGQPLAKAAPRSALRRDLCRIVAEAFKVNGDNNGHKTTG